MASHPGGQIAKLRTMQSLTQGELAKVAGISRPYLARIETGAQMPTVETLDKIATALKVPTGVLFLADIDTDVPALRTLHRIIEKIVEATVMKNKRV